MIKNKLTKKGLVFGILFLLTGSLSACNNNPFIPRADLTVLNIKPKDANKGVSIQQRFKFSGNKNLPDYVYSEPTVSIQNRPGLPRVQLKKMYVTYTIGSQQLSPQEFPVTITVPQGGTFTGQVSILSQTDTLINAVFPDGSFVNSPTGMAEVTLLGVDDLGNIVGVKFATAINFYTDPAGFKEIQQPTDTNEQTDVNNQNTVDQNQ